MAESDPEPTPEAAASSDPFSLIVGGVRYFAGIGLLDIELRPESPRAIPITQERDGTYYLIGLDFETAAEAERFANGLSRFCDRDGARLLFKKPAKINRDEHGNCSGVN